MNKVCYQISNLISTFMKPIIHAIQDEFYALTWAAHRRIHFQFVESKLWINTSYISLCNNVTPQVMSVEL